MDDHLYLPPRTTYRRRRQPAPPRTRDQLRYDSITAQKGLCACCGEPSRTGHLVALNDDQGLPLAFVCPRCHSWARLAPPPTVLRRMADFIERHSKPLRRNTER